MEKLRAVPWEGSTDGALEMATEHAASFEEFFALERDRLFGLLALVTGDRYEAEDLAQDAFAAVWERWDRVGSMENPTGYLQRTAINRFRRKYRRERILRGIVPFLVSAEAIGSADSSILLNEAIRSLTPRQRAALVLTELLGYSASEAGDLLGVKPSTIGALKHQGRKSLRRDTESTDD